MANIAHNVSAFNDLVGAASMEITLQKREEILSLKEETVLGFVKFLKKTKGWVDEKIVGKFKEAPTHLKPVIKLAFKDATMLVVACLLDKITSESDDANYSATKEQFIDLIVLNTEFKEEFEGALKNGEINKSDVAIIIDKNTTGLNFCQVFTVHDIIYNNPYIELLRPELPFFIFLE